MSDSVVDLASRYINSGIIIDTNLLLLLFVGSFDKRLIQQFKRTKQFTSDDYDLLQTYLEPFHRIITTPHVLAETNSLSNSLQNAWKLAYYGVVSNLLMDLIEIHIPSATIGKSAAFRKYGLTDAGIFLLSSEANYLVLTDDLPLSIFLSSNNIDVVNFNHLRQWFFD